MDKLDRILDKLDHHGRLLERHSVLHEQNTEDLKEHMRRTQLLEMRVDKVELPMKAMKWGVSVVAALASCWAVIEAGGKWLLK